MNLFPWKQSLLWAFYVLLSVPTVANLMPYHFE